MTNPYLEYIADLSYMFKVKSMVLIKFSVVCVIGIIVFIAIKKKWTAVICTILLVVFAPLCYFKELNPIQKDISQQSFIKYEGEFYISDIYTGFREETRIYIESPSQSKLKPVRTVYTLRCTVDGYDKPGKYTGYYIYSKHYGYIYEIHCQKIA